MRLVAVAVSSPEHAERARQGLIGAFTRVTGGRLGAMAAPPEGLKLADAPFAAYEVVLTGHGPHEARAALADAFQDAPVDWCVRPADLPLPKLVVCDMDSTIIDCECIDEIARLAGPETGAAIAAVTEAAMRGELDFETSLRERVRALEGLPVEALETVWAERVRLNPGAAAMIAAVRSEGAFAALVSGGFTFFTARVAAAAGFDAQHANKLAVEDSRLTGEVEEPVLGPNAKRDYLERYMHELGVDPRETVAIGDGANDLEMMKSAGLSIAYRAKPVVADKAHGRIQTGDLRASLFFMGFDSRLVAETA